MSKQELKFLQDCERDYTLLDCSEIAKELDVLTIKISELAQVTKLTSCFDLESINTFKSELEFYQELERCLVELYNKKNVERSIEREKREIQVVIKYLTSELERSASALRFFGYSKHDRKKATERFYVLKHLLKERETILATY